MVNGGDDLIVQLRGSSPTLGSNPTVRVPADQRREILAQLQSEGLEIIINTTTTIPTNCCRITTRI